MLFDSFSFLYIFLPLTLFLFYAASGFRHLKLCLFILLAASLVFYAHWRPKDLYLILLSITFNYVMGVLIQKCPRPKQCLIAGIAANLLLLGFFKYSAFILGSAASLIGLHVRVRQQHLPLGISFYTFTQIAYLVDIYQKKTRPAGLGSYSLFTVFFPHLVAGPIVHYSTLMPQFDSLRKRVFQPKNIFLGLFFFITGLFQKKVFADAMGPLADAGFAHAGSLSLIESWTATLAYTLQIYFDFAGYSNMAIGLALLFNIHFPINFNSPYQAISIIDFWKRWHITLSTFLRDYLYIPLGGNRLGEGRRYLNIFITMLIGGLWHGAAWTFVLWGAYHGVLIVLNHAWERSGRKIPAGLSRAVTFLLAAYGWVIFRSRSLDQTAAMTKNLFGLSTAAAHPCYFAVYQLAIMALILAVALFGRNALWWQRHIKPDTAGTLVLCGMYAASFAVISRAAVPSAFLYWQF